VEGQGVEGQGDLGLRGPCGNPPRALLVRGGHTHTYTPLVQAGTAWGEPGQTKEQGPRCTHDEHMHIPLHAVNGKAKEGSRGLGGGIPSEIKHVKFKAEGVGRTSKRGHHALWLLRAHGPPAPAAATSLAPFARPHCPWRTLHGGGAMPQRAGGSFAHCRRCWRRSVGRRGGVAAPGPPGGAACLYRTWTAHPHT
jgi:hypothetical protein